MIYHNIFAGALLIFAFGLGGFFVLGGAFADADTAAELRNKIEERNGQLQLLENEIAKYEAELTKVGADRETLEAKITQLDISRKKIAADIAATRNRIETTDFQLDELDEAIVDKERRISESRSTIEESLRQIAHIDETSLVEFFLAGEAFSDAWEEADRLRRVQQALRDEIINLDAARRGLASDHESVAKKQETLVSYQRQLSGQKVVLDQNLDEQTSILTETKNKESEYQKILDEKRAAAEQLEAELREFESQLTYTLDRSKIPSAGSGVLSFPLDPDFMKRCRGREGVFGNLFCITQYFGNTKFAQSGAYNGKGHNGIDFGAPTGTKVVSARAGVVEATGDTDRIVSGSKVRVTFSRLNVRVTPNGAIAGVQGAGGTGVALEGPVSAGTYRWWRINFNQGIDGWVAEDAISNMCFSYGRWALVRHSNGLATLYSHLSHIGVSKGETVSGGGFIGYSGVTGYATGPHLHFTVYVADQVQLVKLGDIKSITNCAAATVPVAPTEAYLNPLNYL